nr:MAG TPA: hypothetical protein [Caudoviricetes sp.]
MILNHTSRILSFLFLIPFPKIIPGEKCFAFIQGVWDLFFLSFEIQFAYNLLRFWIPT